MVEVELEPDLSNCVQTVAKREYEQILRELLKASERNEELEEKVEILRLFLESSDFPKLRSEYEKNLLEGRKVKFVVRSVRGKVEYDINLD